MTETKNENRHKEGAEALRLIEESVLRLKGRVSTLGDHERLLLISIREHLESQCWGNCDCDDGEGRICNECYTLYIIELVDKLLWGSLDVAEPQRLCDPGERTIVDYWRERNNKNGDRLYLIRAIMGEGWDLTARDCMVATTLVQWFATNVGSGFMREAFEKFMGADELTRRVELDGAFVSNLTNFNDSSDERRAEVALQLCGEVVKNNVPDESKNKSMIKRMTRTFAGLVLKLAKSGIQLPPSDLETSRHITPEDDE